jgi:hypothetical protein
LRYWSRPHALAEEAQVALLSSFPIWMAHLPLGDKQQGYVDQLNLAARRITRAQIDTSELLQFVDYGEKH